MHGRIRMLGGRTIGWTARVPRAHVHLLRLYARSKVETLSCPLHERRCSLLVWRHLSDANW
ncbi:hypothetical protein BDA96_02G226600 [Sorghum bicolor]|uniref:Uncharacterized protein n=2 Tax=Sorghum bicolor TaxID=4558 RepID=A0A1W0W589_SORBI|nr:hypothetical protein BDA96_02G226600 [Sorghum bicolor]OQU89568.1 hypothetical protein SORBI_3002G216250 [Sorghum bicolor]OQU89569.1 hypothetical protein SORBI_3002G216250 [Sorghum bicolor]